jgi:hypothetical protein
VGEQKTIDANANYMHGEHLVATSTVVVRETTARRLARMDA